MKSTSARRQTWSPSSLASSRDVEQRIIRRGVGVGRVQLQRAVQKRLHARGELRAAADLRDVAHFADHAGELVGIFVAGQRASEHQHDGRQRRLREVGLDVDAPRRQAWRRRDGELRPQLAPAVAKVRQGAAVDRVEEHDLAGRRQHGARRRDAAVREARAGVKAAQRREQVEQESQGRVHARRRAGLRGRVEELCEAAPGHELGHDDQRAVEVALDGSRPRDALVFEGAERVEPIAQHVLERPELGPQHQPLEHDPFLAVERERAAAEPVGKAGRGHRGL